MSTELPNPYPDDAMHRLRVEPGLNALRQDLRDVQPVAADSGRTGRRPRRWVAVVAAAAAVAAAVAVPTLFAGGSEDPAGEPSGAAAPVASPEPPSPSPQPDPTEEPPSVPSASWRGPASYAALDAPGWRVDSVQTDPDYGVSVGYRGSGERYLGLEWIRERWYVDVRDGALAESPGSSTTEVLGQRADYVTYEAQQVAYLPVVEGYGLEVEGTFTTEAEFADLVAQLGEVNEAGLADALPRDVVDPDGTARAVADLLEGAALPPGLEVPEVAGFNRLEDISRVLAAAVGCGWAEEYVAARSAGDTAAQEQAIDALEGDTVYQTLSDLRSDRAGYAETVRLMRADAPDQRITGSACPTESLAGAAIDE